MIWSNVCRSTQKRLLYCWFGMPCNVKISREWHLIDCAFMGVQRGTWLAHVLWWCFHRQLKGAIDDCSCSVETIDSFNNLKIYPRLNSLLQQVFFRYWKVRHSKEAGNTVIIIIINKNVVHHSLRSLNYFFYMCFYIKFV